MGSILAPLPTESCVRALHPQGFLSSDTPSLAQLQDGGFALCPYPERRMSLPVIGSGKYTRCHSLGCELERHSMEWVLGGQPVRTMNSFCLFVFVVVVL